MRCKSFSLKYVGLELLKLMAVYFFQVAFDVTHGLQNGTTPDRGQWSGFKTAERFHV